MYVCVCGGGGRGEGVGRLGSFGSEVEVNHVYEDNTMFFFENILPYLTKKFRKVVIFKRHYDGTKVVPLVDFSFLVVLTFFDVRSFPGPTGNVPQAYPVTNVPITYMLPNTILLRRPTKKKRHHFFDHSRYINTCELRTHTS